MIVKVRAASQQGPGIRSVLSATLEAAAYRHGFNSPPSRGHANSAPPVSRHGDIDQSRWVKVQRIHLIDVLLA